MSLDNVEIKNDEIELIDLIKVVLKRKVMICVLTLILTFLATVICFILPQKHSTSILLELGQDEVGKVVVSPQAIKAVIDNDSYGDTIRQKLSLGQQFGLNFKVRIPKGTEVLAVSYQTTQPDLGIRVLTTLQELISLDVDSKLEHKRSQINDKIELAVIEQDSLQGKIKLLQLQIEQLKASIGDLQKARNAVFSHPVRDAMAILLYSNEIKDGFEYLNQREEQLKDYEKRVLSGQVHVRELKRATNYLHGVYAYKQPTVSDQPISSKKALVIALGFVLGLFCSIMIAFLIEYLHVLREDIR